MNVTQTIPDLLGQAGTAPTPSPGTSTFNKYELYGAYHYNPTLGSPSFRKYDLRLAARYLTAVKLLQPELNDIVLDAGSGEGVASFLCCRQGARCLAVELDPEAARLGNQIARREGLAPDRLVFKQENLYALSLADQSVDKVISLEVIEHMADLPAYLGELFRVLKPGGCLVVSTPMKRPDGVLQDRFHVAEFDHQSLHQTLSTVFSQVEVFSGWPGAMNAAYESNQPFLLFAKIRRALIRIKAFHGRNPFVRPVPPDPTCALILASAIKPYTSTPSQ